MKTFVLRILPFLFIAAIFSSCSSSSDLGSNAIVKKRKYTKGYHVDFRQKNESKTKKMMTAEARPNEMIGSAPESHQVQTLDLSASVRTEISETDILPNRNTVADAPVSSDNREIVSEEAPVYATSMKEAKKILRKSIRESRKEMKAASSSAAQQADPLLLYIVLAIILPPLAVGLLYGIGPEFWISLVLTIIFWVPGVIYALFKVLTH